MLLEQKNPACAGAAHANAVVYPFLSPAGTSDCGQHPSNHSVHGYYWRGTGTAAGAQHPYVQATWQPADIISPIQGQTQVREVQARVPSQEQYPPQ